MDLFGSPSYHKNYAGERVKVLTKKAIFSSEWRMKSKARICRVVDDVNWVKHCFFSLNEKIYLLEAVYLLKLCTTEDELKMNDVKWNREYEDIENANFGFESLLIHGNKPAQNCWFMRFSCVSNVSYCCIYLHINCILGENEWVSNILVFYVTEWNGLLQSKSWYAIAC